MLVAHFVALSRRLSCRLSRRYNRGCRRDDRDGLDGGGGGGGGAGSARGGRIGAVTLPSA